MPQEMAAFASLSFAKGFSETAVAKAGVFDVDGQAYRRGTQHIGAIAPIELGDISIPGWAHVQNVGNADVELLASVNASRAFALLRPGEFFTGRLAAQTPAARSNSPSLIEYLIVEDSTFSSPSNPDPLGTWDKAEYYKFADMMLLTLHWPHPVTLVGYPQPIILLGSNNAVFADNNPSPHTSDTITFEYPTSNDVGPVSVGSFTSPPSYTWFDQSFSFSVTAVARDDGSALNGTMGVWFHRESVPNQAFSLVVDENQIAQVHLAMDGTGAPTSTWNDFQSALFGSPLMNIVVTGDGTVKIAAMTDAPVMLEGGKDSGVMWDYHSGDVIDPATGKRFQPDGITLDTFPTLIDMPASVAVFDKQTYAPGETITVTVTTPVPAYCFGGMMNVTTGSGSAVLVCQNDTNQATIFTFVGAGPSQLGTLAFSGSQDNPSWIIDPGVFLLGQGFPTGRDLTSIIAVDSMPTVA